MRARLAGLAVAGVLIGSYFVEHNPIAGSISTSGDASASLASSCAAATDEAALDRPNVYAEGRGNRGPARLTEGSLSAETGACSSYPPAAHAAWRWTVAGVLPAVVRALTAELGARPAELRVALGPAIGACCFEVGPEVAREFEAVLGGAADAVMPSPRGVPGKWHVDLKAANRVLLARAGVGPDAVDVIPDCTCHDAARFFSYRRDRETGQLMGIVARRV